MSLGAALVLAPAGPGAAAGGGAWVDPTRPPASVRAPEGAAGEAADPALRLDSILIGDGRRVALIDGRAYGVGDRVGSLTVQNIFRDRVVLQGRGGTRILRLTMSSGMKKAPSP
jgi:hypothetical protein